MFKLVSGIVTGTGEATHLGRYTLTGPVAIMVPLTAEGADLTAPEPITTVGPSTFTAANGDLLYATAVGVVECTPSPLHAVLSWTIVGGTGRFRDATGGFTEHANGASPCGVLAAPSTSVSEGTISSPGSNK